MSRTPAPSSAQTFEGEPDRRHDVHRGSDPRDTPGQSTSSSDIDADRLRARIGALVDDVRPANPLTQCITNSVVTGFTANVLLAAGASPAMVDSIEEGPTFAGVADGLLINIGTLNATSAKAMAATAEARHAAGRGWVLDPVAVGPLPFRTSHARGLLTYQPSIIRANTSEIIGLAGVDAENTGGGRGVDASASVSAAITSGQALANKTGGAVAISGDVDAVLTCASPASSGQRDTTHEAGVARTAIRIANGNTMMTKVTGVGCALGALMAAYAPVADEPRIAAAAATAMMTIAADEALAHSNGPGSFAVKLLDFLGELTGDQVAERAQIAVTT